MIIYNDKFGRSITIGYMWVGIVWETCDIVHLAVIVDIANLLYRGDLLSADLGNDKSNVP